MVVAYAYSVLGMADQCGIPLSPATLAYFASVAGFAGIPHAAIGTTHNSSLSVADTAYFAPAADYAGVHCSCIYGAVWVLNIIHIASVGIVLPPGTPASIVGSIVAGGYGTGGGGGRGTGTSRIASA